MAFWGIEIKCGQPYVYDSKQSKGRRLRVTQATLKDAEEPSNINSPSLVQLKVGRKSSPITLCKLRPDTEEWCRLLGLEFQESQELIFYVSGSNNVYLTGYYLDERTYNPSPQTHHLVSSAAPTINLESDDSFIQYSASSNKGKKENNGNKSKKTEKAEDKGKSMFNIFGDDESSSSSDQDETLGIIFAKKKKLQLAKGHKH